jgi:hypothetical protein
MQFLIGLGCFVAAAAFYYYVGYSPQQQDDWDKLPTLSEYLDKNTECKTSDDENAKCYSCGSDKVIFQPLTTHLDPRHKHVCLSCSRILFKSKSIMS